MTGFETKAPTGGTPATGTQVPPAPGRRVLIWVGLAALAATAVVGSNMFAVRDRLLGSAAPEPAPPAPSREAGASTPGPTREPTALRSQPWWQKVADLAGTGAASSSPFAIDDSTIQWRVRPTCGSGRLQVRTPGQPKPFLDTPCPATGAIGYSTSNDVTRVEVQADGPWRLELAQQIDAPLVEPPTPAMTAAGAAAIGSGPFYDIDKTATGKVTVYRQADGRFSLRLDDFFVTPNTDLEIRLSPLEAPRTSEEFMSTRSERVVVMDVTAGSLNYTLPEGIDPSRFGSVVIWCAPISSAYGAASLGAAG